MRGMKITISAALLAFGAVAAEAATFRVTQAGVDTLSAVETSTVKREHGLAVAWLYTEFWEPKMQSGRSVVRIKTKTLVDCGADRLRPLTVVPYTASGDALPELRGQAPAPWIDIPPGSAGVATLDAVCWSDFKSALSRIEWSDYEEMVRVHREVLAR